MRAVSQCTREFSTDPALVLHLARMRVKSIAPQRRGGSDAFSGTCTELGADMIAPGTERAFF